MGRILITGAAGQIGTELTQFLREQYGDTDVIASDVRAASETPLAELGPYVQLDVCNAQEIAAVVQEHQVDVVYHLAALLSAVAEHSPWKAWDINVEGALKVLRVAAEVGKMKVFIPSSIAAFGPSTPLDQTPQDTIQRPTSMYGITKVAMELMGDYCARFGVDCRGVRLPGIISYKTPPGGGTTDYAIDMFVYALRKQHYACFLQEDASLDMMYMPDALKAITGVMEADRSSLEHANSFNVTSFQCTPASLAQAIRKHVPDFSCSFEPDPIRQAIADSWPNSMDDQAARDEWGWNPTYSFEAMVEDMLVQMPAFIDSFPVL